MIRFKKSTSICFIFTVMSHQFLFAQNITDTISVQPKETTVIENDEAYKFNYKKLIVPAVFVSYGVSSLKFDGVKQLNASTRDEINEHRPDQTISALTILRNMLKLLWYMV